MSETNNVIEIDGETYVKMGKCEYQRYCVYKIIEPQIKGCLDREKEYIQQLKTVKEDTVKDLVKQLKEITCEMYLKEQLHRCIDEVAKNFVENS